jgi:predicted nucleic acid-binding protein
LTLVLDADVLIGALDGSDPHHEAARRSFTSWHEDGTSLLVSVANLTEVLVAPAAERKRLRTARQAITALGVAVHRPSEAIGVDAAGLRTRHPISLPDAYCLATAKHAAGSIVSFDRKVVRAAEAERIALVAVTPRRRR